MDRSRPRACEKETLAGPILNDGVHEAERKPLVPVRVDERERWNKWPAELGNRALADLTFIDLGLILQRPDPRQCTNRALQRVRMGGFGVVELCDQHVAQIWIADCVL